MARIPLMLIPLQLSVRWFHRLLGIGTLLSKVVPGLKYDLQEMDLDIKVEAYAVAALVNAILYALVFSGLFYLLLTTSGRSPLLALAYAFLILLGLLLLFFYLLMRYPRILAGKKAEQIDKVLVFALKDVWLQVSSGVSFYNAMVTVSRSHYGLVSKEFRIAVQDLNRGFTMEQALDAMAKRSKSQYLRRAIWQLTNTLKAGASMKGALHTLLDDLSRAQRTKIKDYTQELNLWTLLYMMFAVAIPTLGATMLVILSGFAGFAVTPVSFVSFIVFTIFIQLALIGFIKSRRPLVQL